MGEPAAITALDTLEVSPLFTNCYVLKVASGETAVVDPGGNADRVTAALEALGGGLAYILCTHGHVDHIEAAGAVKARLGGRIVLHRGDLPLWEGVELQARMFGLPPPRSLPPPDRILEAEEVLTIGSIPVEVRHVPGHSPGHVLYLFKDQGVCFNGDTVFAMGVGRTDLWGGNGDQLRASVQEKLFSLPDDVVLYSGHGPPATVKEARRNEPYLDLV